MNSKDEIQNEEKASQERRLHALLLADFIYRDENTGKYVLAGIFHQINVETVPTIFGRTIGVFVSLTGLIGDNNIDIEFFDPIDKSVLTSSYPIKINCKEDVQLPIEFGVEIPPLPLPRTGIFHFRLIVNGEVLGFSPLVVHCAQIKGS